MTGHVIQYDLIQEAGRPLALNSWTLVSQLQAGGWQATGTQQLDACEPTPSGLRDLLNDWSCDSV
eukprot:1161578-Pelagomonas_calceolata.AAC.10